MKFSEYCDTHPEYVEAVISAKSERDQKLNKIAQCDDRDKKRFLIRLFLNDFRMKRFYLMKSLKAKQAFNGFEPHILDEVAKAICAFHPMEEPVERVKIKTGARSNRITYKFGPRKHALQTMVSDVLKAVFPLSTDRHFTIIGGVRAALYAVEEHVRNGFKFGIERDIEQFYPSVDIPELAKLLRPLPGSVVMNIISYEPNPNDEDHSSSASVDLNEPTSPGGSLAQGSAASSIAAEIVMNDLLKDMPSNVRMVAFADNVLILGENENSVNAANNILEVHALGHDCGPLRLKSNSYVQDLTIEPGISFLGHHGLWTGSNISWSPSNSARMRIEEVIETSETVSEIFKTLKKISNWSRSFKWSNENEQAETILTYTAQLAAKMAFISDGPLTTPYRYGLEIVVACCKSMASRNGYYPDLAELLPDYRDDFRKDGVRPKFIRSVEAHLGMGNSRV